MFQKYRKSIVSFSCIAQVHGKKTNNGTNPNRTHFTNILESNKCDYLYNKLICVRLLLYVCPLNMRCTQQYVHSMCLFQFPRYPIYPNQSEIEKGPPKRFRERFVTYWLYRRAGWLLACFYFWGRNAACNTLQWFDVYLCLCGCAEVISIPTVYTMNKESELNTAYMEGPAKCVSAYLRQFLDLTKIIVVTSEWMITVIIRLDEFSRFIFQN